RGWPVRRPRRTPHPRAGCGRGRPSSPSSSGRTTFAWTGTPIPGPILARSALDDVDRQAPARGFLVLVLHVPAGVAHGLDDLVQADLVLAVAAQGHARGIDGLDRAHGVALDAGDLHQAPDRVAGQAEIVFHADLGRILDLRHGRAHGRGQAAGRHRAGHADLALAADLGAADRGVFLVQDADRGGGQEVVEDALFAGARHELLVVVADGGDDAGRAVGGCGHHA